ncbi:MAG: hypothetical protein KBS36_02690, partial [Bacteroidales bacterium]|nr:hypothetical protein [Candidatus Cryptobacteroides fimicaballi]
RKTVLILTSVLALVCSQAKAQLYTQGNEPGSLKWSQISPGTYRIVYPSGLDSLARAYAICLESYADKVSLSSGYRPNQSYSRPMPVILHPYVALSNGMVTWAPRRMELFTVPDATAPLPGPNDRQLAAHESRHVSQMQFGAARPYRWLKVVSGDLWAGAMSALYPGQTFMEGDAVAAETELSRFGRGHTSYFLNYYDIAFSEGDYRDYWKWSRGSIKNYTPDQYRAGYFLIAGIRSEYSDPLFTARYFNNVNSGWPLPLFNLQKTIRQASGKNLKDTFRELAEIRRAEWAEAAESRKPFMEMHRLSPEPRRYTALRELTVTDSSDLVAVLSGLDRVSEIVRIDRGGRTKRLSYCSASASGFTYSDSLRRLYWNEIIRDPRWELKSSSAIRYLDASGKTATLTKGYCRYYNPKVDGRNIAVAEYPAEGGCRIVILDALDGKIKQRTALPDSMQAVQFCWMEGRLFFSAVTQEGCGIYDSSLNPVLKPRHNTISDLFSKDGRIYFTADRNGSRELYSILPGGTVRQHTSSRFGGTFYRFEGDSLYFLSGSTKDYALYSTPVADLPSREVEFDEPVPDRMSSDLNAQADSLEYKTATPVIGAPEKYSKAAHLFRFHSWLPIYFKYDGIADLSMESLRSMAGLGVSAMFQNDLSTMQGMLGYSAWNPASGWRNSFHGNFTYSGWYPVIEARFDVNDSDAFEYFESKDKDGKTVIKKRSLGKPSFNAGLRMYVPLLFSSGGWKRGIVPQIQLGLNNDCFLSSDNQPLPLHTITASVRGYSMLSVPKACIYPRFGIGAEAGFSSYFSRGKYLTPLYYGFLYGYLPGIARTHGIRWTAKLEKQGSVDSQITAAYAFPFAAVDWSFLEPVAYIRNFEFTGQFLWTHQ